MYVLRVFLSIVSLCVSVNSQREDQTSNDDDGVFAYICMFFFGVPLIRSPLITGDSDAPVKTKKKKTVTPKKPKLKTSKNASKVSMRECICASVCGFSLPCCNQTAPSSSDAATAAAGIPPEPTVLEVNVSFLSNRILLVSLIHCHSQKFCALSAGEMAHLVSVISDATVRMSLQNTQHVPESSELNVSKAQWVKFFKGCDVNIEEEEADLSLDEVAESVDPAPDSANGSCVCVCVQPISSF